MDKLCILCFIPFDPAPGAGLDEHLGVSPKLLDFCRVLKMDCQGLGSTLWNEVALCDDCSESVAKVVNVLKVKKEVEGDVRRLDGELREKRGALKKATRTLKIECWRLEAVLQRSKADALGSRRKGDGAEELENFIFAFRKGLEEFSQVETLNGDLGSPADQEKQPSEEDGRGVERKEGVVNLAEGIEEASSSGRLTDIPIVLEAVPGNAAEVQSNLEVLDPSGVVVDAGLVVEQSSGESIEEETQGLREEEKTPPDEETASDKVHEILRSSERKGLRTRKTGDAGEVMSEDWVTLTKVKRSLSGNCCKRKQRWKLRFAHGAKRRKACTATSGDLADTPGVSEVGRGITPLELHANHEVQDPSAVVNDSGEVKTEFRCIEKANKVARTVEVDNNAPPRLSYYGPPEAGGGNTEELLDQSVMPVLEAELQEYIFGGQGETGQRAMKRLPGQITESYIMDLLPSTLRSPAENPKEWESVLGSVEAERIQSRIRNAALVVLAEREENQSDSNGLEKRGRKKKKVTVQVTTSDLVDLRADSLLALGVPSSRKSNASIQNRDEGSRLKCNQCGCTFKSLNCLKAHEKRVHLKKKLILCDQCGLSFFAKWELLQHLRVHSKEKPFACGLCHVRFSQKSNLVSHFRKHTGEKPHRCEVCGKRFTHRFNLTVHRRNHPGLNFKPFCCIFCKARYSSRFHLYIHIRTHTGERPFNCTQCSQEFAATKQLKEHKCPAAV